jgi:hypothetical protein
MVVPEREELEAREREVAVILIVVAEAEAAWRREMEDAVNPPMVRVPKLAVTEELAEAVTESE